MAIEVEQKFRVTDVPALEQQLVALGAEPGASETQVDRYYAHPSRDFAESDEALRLRRVGSHNYITYKGPKLDATTKTRREIELPLPPEEVGFAEAAGLLEALSFRPVADVAKTRRHYTMPWQSQRIGVALDHIESLGDFVELEIVADERQMKAAQAAIATLAARLNLCNSERRSYLELLLTSQDGLGGRS